MVIMENLQNPEAISVVANKIVSIVKEPIIFGEQTLNLGTSIGISVYPQNGETSEALIKSADIAMYKAKDEGRDNYQFYTPEMKALALERMENEAALRNAVENEELILYFQPQVDVERDEISGYDVNIRWQHPQKGLIDFSEFKQLAVEIGVLLKIEQWLLKTALLESGKRQKESMMTKRMILNLSMKLVMQKAFVDELKELLEHNQCYPKDIVIGIREGELLGNQERAITALQVLSEMGLKLTINEFGIADISLTYLSRLPVNNLRVDRSLTADIVKNSAVLKAASALAQSLGLEVIAEGVDTENERVFLKEQGYAFMQGTLFGSAVTALDMNQN